jgi:putative transposase
MSLSSGNRFRCYPTEEQKLALSQWMGCQNLIYNAKVAEDRYFRAMGRKALSLTGMKPPVDQKYSQFKDRELTPYLYDVPSQILRNGATRFKQAYSRFFMGLANRPAFKKKHGKKSVWITGDLFKFKADGKLRKKKNKTIYDHRLFIGTGKYALGELKFTPSDEYQVPSTITISKTGARWFVSFSYEKDVAVASEQEIMDHYRSLKHEDLEKIAVGSDRGTVSPVTADSGETHDFCDAQKKRMERKEKRKKKYQKIMARRKLGSKRRNRVKVAVARISAYSANVRNEFAHQVSRLMVDGGKEVFVFEDLKTKNMTRAPRPVKDGNGKFLPNGASKKAGLNKAILASAWGKVVLFTAYKARRAGKLVITVPPHHTSQECSRCSHTHPDNRPTRAAFVCKNCGFTANADHNAAKVIKDRGIRMLLGGEITVKEKKKTMRLKKKVILGQELADVMRVGEGVRRPSGLPEVYTLPSMIRETPTTTVLTV